MSHVVNDLILLPYLKAVGMDNFIANGALHKHEVELVLLFLHCVLFSCLFTHHTDCSVGQDRLQNTDTIMTHLNANRVYKRKFFWLLISQIHMPAYCNALPHYAWLLHAAWTSKLFHVLAEVALSAFGPKACFTSSTSCSPASGSRRASVRWQFNSRRCSSCHCHYLGLWTVGWTLLKEHQERDKCILLRLSLILKDLCHCCNQVPHCSYLLI